MASSDSQIDKPQRGRPKRVELPDVNINTGTQSSNTERASLKLESLSLAVSFLFSYYVVVFACCKNTASLP